MNPIDALRLEFGELQKLAEPLGVTREAVYQWTRIPHRHVKKICELSEGRLTPEMLRPDLFGK